MTSGTPVHNRMEKFTLTTSRQFESWMAEQGVSLVFSTYQAGKIFFLGLGAEGRLSVFERTLDRCMALCAEGDTLWVSTLYQLWRFDNVLGAGEDYQGYDRLFAPRRSWVTGDLDIHDIHLDADGAPVFANTLFSCLATVSDTHSFKPLWRPPFISRLAAEDRCHLNGFAMRGGEPAYATAVSASDVADGWRDRRVDGGILIDVRSGEIIASALSMPHSPRVYRDQVWVLNAGSGEFGRIDTNTGVFEPIAFCPGYARGLSFHDDFALITLSLPRENRTFSGLPLDDALAERSAEPRCGLMVVDLTTGEAPHWVRIEGVVTELFDVAPLPGVRRPSAIGFKSDEIRRVISVG
ncbi:MAG: TIGR03032 family protein [Pseudomonadota bacterium]